MTVALIPIFGMISGCGIALLAIWTEYRRDRVSVEEGPYQPEGREPVAPSGRGFLVAGSMLERKR